IDRIVGVRLRAIYAVTATLASAAAATVPTTNSRRSILAIGYSLESNCAVRLTGSSAYLSNQRPACGRLMDREVSRQTACYGWENFVTDGIDPAVRIWRSQS